jgi:gamma-glutamyltranspeptidase / glutathione hydrolase
MAPTILLSHGKPFLATGSPGGSTIITTVFQILLNRIDFGMMLPEVSRPPGQPAQHGGGAGRAGVPGVAGGGQVDGAGPCVHAEPGDRWFSGGRRPAQ